MKAGIPRALFFHYYYPLWRAFLEELGIEVVTSPPTDKSILNRGLGRVVDEACLPVKLFFGHALELAPRVDCLFVPRLISVERGAYICPKLIGLPDMLRASLPELPPLISPAVDMGRREGEGLRLAGREVGRMLKKDLPTVEGAWRKALRVYRRYRLLLRRGFLPWEALAENGGEQMARPAPAEKEGGFKVAVLGHAYNLYDRYFSMDLLQKVRAAGARVVTAEMLPARDITAGESLLPKRLFWSLGRRMLGGYLYLQGREEVGGVICLTSFGCGPDSLVAELVERYARRAGKPLLCLTIDEQTGEAGLNTRLEAFLDVLERKCAR